MFVFDGKNSEESIRSPAYYFPHKPLILWSGRPGSNRRHSAWEADVLPLNYSRNLFTISELRCQLETIGYTENHCGSGYLLVIPPWPGGMKITKRRYQTERVRYVPHSQGFAREFRFYITAPSGKRKLIAQRFDFLRLATVSQ